MSFLCFSGHFDMLRAILEPIHKNKHFSGGGFNKFNLKCIYLQQKSLYICRTVLINPYMSSLCFSGHFDMLHAIV